MPHADELKSRCIQFSFIYIPSKPPVTSMCKVDPVFGYDAVTDKYPIFHFVDFFNDIGSVVDWLNSFRKLPPTRQYHPEWMPTFIMKDDVIEVDTKTGYIYGRMDHLLLGNQVNWTNGGFPIGKVEEVYL